MRKRARNQQRDPSRSPAERMPGADIGTEPNGQKPPRWRGLWFRAIALALPLIVLLGLELVLRIFGYGFPTGFFLPKSAEGKPVLIENQQFGWRFFPAAVARSPEPICVPERKPADGLRVFVFGESAAMGDPEPAYGMARQLQVMLQVRFPDKHVEVINVAMTAINSHVVRQIARDCKARHGDFWIIYAGNNEVVGPFGAGTVFGHQAPPLPVVRATLALKSTRLGQMLTSATTKSGSPSEWMGMEFFLDQQVAASDARLPRVYDSFDRNLRDVVAYGRSSGAKVLLSTVAVNLKDCPPFGSLHRAGLAPSGVKQWEEHFRAGREADNRADYVAALQSFRQAEAIDPQHAELLFRLARCELATGDRSGAEKHFRLARDLDTLRFRADSRLNTIIRGLAKQGGATLIDAEEACAARAAKHLPGEDLFYDHVHLNFTGNYVIARLFAGEIESQLGEKEQFALGETEVSRRLAFTGFDQQRVWEEMRLRLQQPPFSAQLNHAQRDQKLRGLLSGQTNSPATHVNEYKRALDLAQRDWILHANFARVLDAAGDTEAAGRQWRQVAALLPFEASPRFELGNLAYATRKFDEAEKLFAEAIERSVRPVEALNGLGLVKAEQGDEPAALNCFQRALRIAPGSSDTRVNMGVLLARQGNVNGAKEQYAAALRVDTNNIPARINLGKLLARENDIDGAIAVYLEALRLKPADPIVHFNLANAFASKGGFEQAITHYRAAIAARPAFGEAEYSLALTLTKLGRIDESLPHFERALRAMADSADAHFNYGIALARLERFTEALAQFEAVLRLEPSHAAARAALERAMKLR